MPSVKFLTRSPSALLQYMVAKPFIFFLVLRFHKIRQYYEKISTFVQVATHTCRQQNSNFHPVLGESLLRLITVVPSVKFLTRSPSALLQYMVAKPFIFFLVLRFHKIRQYYEKISTFVQVATHTCRQQNSNFHPVLGESLLRLILLLYFSFNR